MNAKFLLVLVVFMLASTGVFAQIVVEPAQPFFDPQVSFSNTISQIPACTSHTDYIQVSNPSVYAQLIQIQAQTDDLRVTVSERKFVLGANEQKQVPVLITAPCGIEKSHSIVYTISHGSDQQIFERVLETYSQNNLVLGVFEQEKESCPCLGTTFSFVLENNGTFTETYMLSSTLGTVSQRSVILNPGKRYTGQVFVQLPCDQQGEFSFTLQADSLQSGYRARIPLTYTVNACFDFGMTYPEQITICEGQEQSFRVNITNMEQNPNWLQATLKRSPVSQRQVASAQLLANQSVEMQFALDAQRLGAHNLTLRVDSLYGPYSSQFFIPVLAQQCFASELILSRTQHLVCDQEQVVPFTIQNDAQINQTFILESDLHLSDEIVDVPAGFSAELFFTIPANYTQTTAQIQYYPQNHTDQLKTIALELEQVAAQECYEVSVQPSRIDQRTTQLTVSGTSYVQREYDIFAVQNISFEPQTLVVADPYPRIINISNISEDVTLVFSSEAFEQQVELAYSPTNVLMWILIALLILGAIFVVLLLLILVRKSPQQSTKVLEKKEPVVEKKPKKQITQKQTSEKKPLWLILLLLILLALFIVGASLFVASILTPADPYQFENVTNITNVTIDYNETIPVENITVQPDPEEINETILPEDPFPFINESIQEFEFSEQMLLTGRIIALVLAALFLLFILLAILLFLLFYVFFKKPVSQTKPKKTVVSKKESKVQKKVSKKEATPKKKRSWTPILMSLLILLLLLIFFAGLGMLYFAQTQYEPVTNVTNVTDPITNITNITNITDPVIEDPVPVDENVTEDDIFAELDESVIAALEKSLEDDVLFFYVAVGENRTVNLSQVFVDPDGEQLYFDVELFDIAHILQNGTLTILGEQPIARNMTLFAHDGESFTTSPPILVIVAPQKVLDHYRNQGQGMPAGSYWLIIFLALLLLVVLYVDYRLVRKQMKK